MKSRKTFLSRHRTKLVTCTLALLTLSGCASNCNFLSSNNSMACDAQMIGLLIITAPVMLPYAAIEHAVEEGRAAQDEIKLRKDVEHCDLAASELCLYECPWGFRELKGDRSRVRQIAAERVVREYEGKQDLSPNQQANLFTANKAWADHVWETSPQERLNRLQEAVRLGQSPALWEYVRKESKDGNSLPVNGSYFSSLADDIAIDWLTLMHAQKIQDGLPPDSPMACELSALGRLVELSDGLHEKSLCELAAEFWKDRHKNSS